MSLGNVTNKLIKFFLKDGITDKNNTEILGLFSRSDELQEYLNTQNLSDISIFLENPDSETPSSEIDLTSEEAEALLNSEKGQTKEAEINPETLDEKGQSKYYLNKIYNDKDTLKYLDTDGDGKISDEEKLKFAAYLKKKKGNLSAKDLKEAYEQMKAGTFPSKDYKDFDITSLFESDDIAQTIQNINGGGTINPFSPGGGNDYSPYTPTNNDDQGPDNSDPLNLNGKNAAELQSMHDSKQEEINESTKALSAIYDNSDTEVAKEKEKTEQSKQEYFDQLDNESEENQKLAQQEKQVIQDISEAQKGISETQASINDYEGMISQTASQISIDESQKASLESAKDAIPEDGEDEEQNEANAAQKEAIEAEIAQVEAKIEEEKQQKEEYETKKGELEEQLKTQQTGLKELETQRDLIENGNKAEGIKGLKETASPETLEALESFNKAEAAFEKFKQNKIDSVKSTISAQQSDLSKIDDKLKEVQNREISNKYSSLGSLFASGVKMEQEYIKGNPPYLLLKPEGADPNEELPMIVFLHGDYQTAANGGSITHFTTPGGVMTEEAGYNLNAFNGYIMVPVGYSGWAGGDSSGALRSTIDSFKQTHNVGQTVLMGASSGADGVVKIANQNWASDYFDSAVAISSFVGDVSNSKIPVMGVVGNSDNGRSIAHMKQTFGSGLITVNSDHNYVVKAALNLDSDHDGNSDIIQMAFEQIKKR